MSIGACVRHAAFHKSVVDNPLGKLLTNVARHIAHYPIRMRGTFCGSLAHADPASEWCLTAATLDATIVAKSTRGERLIAAKDFFEGLMSTALAEDELLAEVRLPLLATRHRSSASTNSTAAPAISRWPRRWSPIACKAARSRCPCRRRRRRSRPRRIEDAETALNGRSPGDKVFRVAAEAAAAAIEPLEDHQTSADYRRDLVQAVVRRALEQAAE